MSSIDFINSTVFKPIEYKGLCIAGHGIKGRLPSALVLIGGVRNFFTEDALSRLIEGNDKALGKVCEEARDELLFAEKTGMYLPNVGWQMQKHVSTVRPAKDEAGSFITHKVVKIEHQSCAPGMK